MRDLESVVPLLRQEARRGRKPSELLRLLAEHPSGAYTFFLVRAFRVAFGVPLRELTMIGGWSPAGGEITDARIAAELGPLIAASPSLSHTESSRA